MTNSILAVMLGMYFGGSIVVVLFWFQGTEELGEEERSFYKWMMVAWPFYAIVITLYRIIKHFRGDLDG